MRRFKFLDRNTYQVITTAEDFQRWTKGLEWMKPNTKYVLTVRRGEAKYLDFIQGVFEFWCVFMNPNHKPKGTWYSKKD